MGETGVTNPDITSYLGTVTAVKGRESLTRLLWRSGGWGGGWGEEGGGGGGRGGPKLVPEGVGSRETSLGGGGGGVTLQLRPLGCLLVGWAALSVGRREILVFLRMKGDDGKGGWALGMRAFKIGESGTCFKDSFTGQSSADQKESL